MGLSTYRDDPPAFFRPEVIRVSLWLVLALWLARQLARLLVWIIRTPSAAATLTVGTAVLLGWHYVDPALPVGVLSGLLAGLVGWRLRWPVTFEAQVRLRLRTWWRAGWVYRRRWATAMDTAGLLVGRRRTDYVPPLLKVRSTRTVDRVRLRMLPGQRVEDYAAVADRLAQTFGALDCRVRSVRKRRHLVELWFLVDDPLEAVVSPFDPAEDALTGGIPVALAEDGIVYRLRLHVSILIVGATGSGKGSVLWSIITGLIPFIRAGLVKVWAIDPKGGMELAPGRHLFDRFARGDAKTAAAAGGYEASLAALLEDAVQVMRERQDRLFGVTRLHTPSTAEPLLVVLVDELAALTAWVNDRAVKKRIESALGLLLSQGRAVGVVVVGAIQDPRKDVLPQRDLFPIRIGLRLNEAEHIDLTLGRAARLRGAACDMIPDTLPGVGYVQVDGITEPVRVRFAHHSDADLATLGHTDRPTLTVVEGGAA
jgi:S-DNA-T family DNA segregation ATPase FtsK/SpoIIIE